MQNYNGDLSPQSSFWLFINEPHSPYPPSAFPPFCMFIQQASSFCSAPLHTKREYVNRNDINTEVFNNNHEEGNNMN
jgi:hypothetical protein